MTTLSKNELLLFFLAALALSFLLYGNTFQNEFVWDDVFFVGRPELADPSHLPKLWFEAVIPNQTAAGLYRPFTVFTYALNLIIGGKDPFGFHLAGILLNGIASFLVFLLAFKLFRNKALAFFAGAFFAFLPIHTEAVALMKARDEMLGAIFMLLSWLCFLEASKRPDGHLHPRWLFASSMLFFIGVLSKEFVVLAPAVFFLVHYFQTPGFLKKTFFRNLLLFALFYGVPFGVYLWMRHIAIPGTSFGNDEISPVSNILVIAPWWPGGLLTPFKILYLYIARTFVPIGLSATYHFKAVTLTLNLLYSWRAMAGVTFSAILIFLIVWKKTRATPLGVGALSFFALYFPFSQFLFRGGDIVGERWMYLPSLGLSFIAGWLFLFLFRKNPRFAIAAFAIVLGLYASVIIPRNRVWRNSVSLFESMVRDSPKSVKGYSTLAQEYLNRGEIAKARELIAKGLAISNQEPNLYVLSALVFYKEKRYALAEEMLLKALNLDTFSPAAVLNFARVQFAQEKYEEAFLVLDQAIAEFPPSSINFSDRVLYAAILAKLGRYEESLAYLKTKLASELDQADVKKLFAGNLYRLGNTEEALKYFDWDARKTEQEKTEMLEEF